MYLFYHLVQGKWNFVGKTSWNIWNLWHTPIHIYPSHVYVFMTSKISRYVQKWRFPLFLICLFPSFLEHCNILMHHILYCPNFYNIKKNYISNILSDGDTNFWYLTFISSSLIPYWIYYPSSKRWPSCFKILMIFCYAEWYSPIFIFLMDALLVPWSGHTQLTSLSNKY
jgi:hypothetical protein